MSPRLGKHVRGQRRGATRGGNPQAVARRCRRHRAAHEVRAGVAGLSRKVKVRACWVALQFTRILPSAVGRISLSDAMPWS